MGGLSQVFSESIDDVLTAVQETPRGRWFLDAYTARIKGEGTTNILSAIAKLESNLERMAGAGASAELLQKARNAIAAARQEIASLEPQDGKLSSEAQLFSNLAELSRKAFSTETTGSGLGKGVERALKLVADLDRDLNPRSGQIECASPPKQAAQYFKQDEEVFEPAPAPAPKLVKPVEPPELANKGAKLTIRKLSADKVISQNEDLSAAKEPKFEPVAIITAEAPPDEKSAEPSRILIIRRKADEHVEVPLVDSVVNGEQQESVDAA